ncbi:MAG: hypothetical protein V7749_01430 [Cocleimonas sp.]
MNNSNLKSIDGALKDHYASKSLSDKQLDYLIAMQEMALAPQASVETSVGPQQATEIDSKSGLSRFLPDFRGYRSAFYATACMLAVCLVVTFSLINQPTLSQRIMDEIAYNHKQDMPIEIESNSVDDVRKYLNKLSFPIISPSALVKANWQLLGGRYCSINGKLAAQLKIKNLENNNIYTLYQAASESGIEKSGATRLTGMIDGIDVSIWREKGLLLGLASSP